MTCIIIAANTNIFELLFPLATRNKILLFLNDFTIASPQIFLIKKTTLNCYLLPVPCPPIYLHQTHSKPRSAQASLVMSLILNSKMFS